jgi:hypothetical protein
MLALLEKYRDHPMDMADASLAVLAERLGITEIPTVDRADFDVYRLLGKRRFVQGGTGRLRERLCVSAFGLHSAHASQ